jgi:uncharacterized protein
MKKLIITGGTGFIGCKLAPVLRDRGYNVTLLTRNIESAKIANPNADEYYLLNENLTSIIDGCFGIINLAGASIAGKRWSKEYKEIVLNSRIGITNKIVEAIKETANKPEVFISTSATGYYGDCDDEFIDENSPAGKDFLANVCSEWENAVLKAQEAPRTVINRTGVVLSKDGGALPRMAFPFKLFFGGKIGSGKQWLPWIHIDDWIELLIWELESNNVKGIFNAVSPNPVRASEFAITLGKVLHRPSIFPVPSFMLKLMLGESSAMLLTGQRAIPKRAMEEGFEFRYKRLEDGLVDLFKN